MEFRPLIAVETAQLFDLLVEERRDWIHDLSWDPGDAQQLLLTYVGHRLLPGLVAVDAGRVVGYTYYLTRERTATIGTLYLTRSHRRPDRVAGLLDATLDCIRRFSPMDRVEAQLFPFGVDLVPAFAALGFQFYRRHYLCKTLAAYSPAPGTADVPAAQSFRFIPWGPQHIERSALIVQAGYTGSIDSEICCEYGSYASCLTFLRNLISNPGCGTFLPSASFIAQDANHLLGGLVLASRLSASTALIAQIAVLPGYQGSGLGSALMTQALSRLRELGFAEVCLSVSEQNERAYPWYRRLGFQPRKELLAFVWRHQAA